MFKLSSFYTDTPPKSSGTFCLAELTYGLSVVKHEVSSDLQHPVCINYEDRRIMCCDAVYSGIYFSKTASRQNTVVSIVSAILTPNLATILTVQSEIQVPLIGVI
jgi:hypothetical protein